MSEYLKKPSLRKKVNVQKGDAYPEGHTRESHIVKPLDSNDQVSGKTEEMKKVEVPDEKILAAKEKRKDSVTKAGLKKPPSKRAGGIADRVSKKSKPSVDDPVIDVEDTECEEILQPKPIRSVNRKDFTGAGT